jgi:anti-sigma-K factor RskA
MSNTSFNQFFTAEYSLGLLNLRETAQAQELFGSSFDAVVSALKWEDRFLALADQLPAVEPSARLLLQIQTALGHETTVPLRPSAAGAGATAKPPTTAPDAATTTIQGAHRLPRHGADRAKSRNTSDANSPRPLRTRLWLVIAIVAIVALAALFVATITLRPTTKVETVVSVPVAATSASSKASSSQAVPAPAIAAESARTPTLATPPAPPSAVPSTQPGQPEPPTSISPVPTPASLAPPMSEAPAPAPSAPGSTSHTTLAAILQAPGQTSTPGWIVTFDPAGDLVLTPKVKIDIPANAAAYLWTHADIEAPRLLAELNPNHAAMVSKAVVGSPPAGQLFEITQETRTATPPKAPKGPILFIGRLVALQ